MYGAICVQLCKSVAKWSNTVKLLSYVVTLNYTKRQVYEIKKYSLQAIVCHLPLGLHRLHKMILDTRPFYTRRPLLWSRGNIVASHLAGPGLIPVLVNFPDWGFFQVFLNCKTNDGKTYSLSIPWYHWSSNFALYSSTNWLPHFKSSFCCFLLLQTCVTGQKLLLT